MALILARKPDEKVYIVDDQGREIEIKVLVDGNDIKLRIDASKDFQIFRGEFQGEFGNNS